MAGLTAELVDSVAVEPELDESVLDESVLEVPVLDESVLEESALEPDELASVEESVPAASVLVDASASDTLVASESAHSCRPSADAAITAATPRVLVMMVASLLPRSCRSISVPPFSSG